MSAPLRVQAFDGLAVQALQGELPVPLGQLATPPWLSRLLAPGAEVPRSPPAALRVELRGMLRQRGYRPTGRGKPSSEYLAQAVAGSRLSAINAVVDAGNAVSLHTGLPISIVDPDRMAEPLHVAVAGAGDRFVFNASGQEIDVAHLPCLFDRTGPCANAVKDAQRSKTTAASRRILAIVWGCVRPDPSLPSAAADWLARLLTDLGLTVTRLPTAPA